jgi:hypothetical protein
LATGHQPEPHRGLRHLMHAHACHGYNGFMRTTVEMKPEHRAALISIATKRGEKGFSSVLAEIIDDYLRSQDDREKKKKKLLSLAGSISAEEGERMKRYVADLRKNWR